MLHGNMSEKSCTRWCLLHKFTPVISPELWGLLIVAHAQHNQHKYIKHKYTRFS